VTALDAHLPRWHHRERHAVPVAAPAAPVLAAFDALTWREVPLFRGLMAVRSLGTTSRTGGRRVLADFTAIGFAQTARTDDEVVYAGIGRPWSLRGGMRGVTSVGDFTGFAEPGWAKMAVNFQVAGGELTTETRVWLTDASARHWFRVYWLGISPFSGLVRRSWLAAVARRAAGVN
jgi:hypothetical protein